MRAGVTDAAVTSSLLELVRKLEISFLCYLFFLNKCMMLCIY